MKVGIMQPYFMPYIGYFQLLNLVDKFVIYDNIQYTKKGWINRNRILLNGQVKYITIPMKKDSDFLNINQRFIAEQWLNDRFKMLKQIQLAYATAPNFNLVFNLIENCLKFESLNLFDFLFNSIKLTNEFLGIDTNLIISSGLKINHDLKSEIKVIEICKNLGAKTYLNPEGGKKLYNSHNFKTNDIDLIFFKPLEFNYKQFRNNSVPNLSIIDVLMFNDLNDVKSFLKIKI